MNPVMQQHTKRLAHKLTSLVVITSLAGTAVALTLRYRQMLTQAANNRAVIRANTQAMRAATSTSYATLAELRRRLPDSNTNGSSEILLFSRIDQIKSALQPQEMTVSPVEHKDGKQSIRFTLKLPVKAYSDTINRMIALEAEIFPFITLTSTTLSRQGDAARSVPVMSVEGSVSMPDTIPAAFPPKNIRRQP